MKTKKFGTFILILTLLMEMLGSFGVAAKAYTVNEEVYNEAGNACALPAKMDTKKLQKTK